MKDGQSRAGCIPLPSTSTERGTLGQLIPRQAARSERSTRKSRGWGELEACSWAPPAAGKQLCHRHRVQQLPAGCAAPCAPLAGLSPEERLGAVSETKQSAGEGVEPLTNPAVSLRTSPLTARPCFCWQLGRMQCWEWLCSELAGMSTVHFF